MVLIFEKKPKKIDGLEHCDRKVCCIPNVCSLKIFRFQCWELVPTPVGFVHAPTVGAHILSQLGEGCHHLRGQSGVFIAAAGGTGRISSGTSLLGVDQGVHKVTGEFRVIKCGTLKLSGEPLLESR